MRITGGKEKGRVLFTPKGLSIRPTSDKVREAIFDIIGHDLRGCMVLDLFAGTGCLGIEALSRGASLAVFVDNAPAALRLIKRNLSLCGYENVSRVVKTDLRKGLKPVSRLLKHTYDLVFLDPPYRKGHLPLLLGEIPRVLDLGEGAWVIAELSRKEDIPSYVTGIEVSGTRTYGDTVLCFFRRT